MKKILAALVLIGGFTVATAAPASAITCITVGELRVGPYAVKPPVVCTPLP